MFGVLSRINVKTLNVIVDTYVGHNLKGEMCP